MRMSMILGLVLLCALLQSAHADGLTTHEIWGDYKIYVSDCEPETLPKQAYPIRNMIDGKKETAWVVYGVELKYGEDRFVFESGREPWVDVEYSGPAYEFTSVVFTSGYARDSETFKRNGRVSKVRIEVGDKTLEKNLEDTMLPQEIRLPDSGRLPLARVRITILEAIPGSASADLCISEIRFANDWNCTVADVPSEYYSKFCNGNTCGCEGEYYEYCTAEGDRINVDGIMCPTEYYEATPEGEMDYYDFQESTHNDYIAIYPEGRQGVAVYHRSKLIYFNNLPFVTEVRWTRSEVIFKGDDGEIVFDLKSAFGKSQKAGVVNEEPESE